MNIIKEAVGTDVSKDSVTVCFGSMDDQQNITITKSVTFPNTPKGHKQFLAWVLKQSSLKPWFLMEATGVYYENLAYFLSEQGQQVAVVLPNKTKSYAKTLEQKSKTDSIDAAALTQFALERQLKAWNIPADLMRSLKLLSREYITIKQMATQVKNQIHAKESSYKPLNSTISRLHEQLRLFDKQLKRIEKQIHKLIDEDPDLKNKIDNIDKVEGLGFMTIVTIVAETNGFALFENHKQLASYSGLDVVFNQSGLKKGKTSISKKGNKFIRTALFLPAMVAARFNPKLKELYIRLLIKKNVKKLALIAVARKLLVLIFTLWKNNSSYMSNYNRQLSVNIR